MIRAHDFRRFQLEFGSMMKTLQLLRRKLTW
jgi:hypothetical protein